VISRRIETSRLSLAAVLIRVAWWQRAVTKRGATAFIPRCFSARLRLCPHAVFIKPRFDAYQAASVQIRQIFAGYSDLVEPLSLDEAYLDVSDAAMLQGSANLDCQGH